MLGKQASQEALARTWWPMEEHSLRKLEEVTRELLHLCDSIVDELLNAVSQALGNQARPLNPGSLQLGELDPKEVRDHVAKSLCFPHIVFITFQPLIALIEILAQVLPLILICLQDDWLELHFEFLLILLFEVLKE